MSANKIKPDHEELRLLYQVTAGDLTYFKTQQWSVTNYSLLLYAGLVGVAQMLKPNFQSGDRALLVAGIAFAFTAALVVLYKLQVSIAIRQARLDAVREKFTNEFHLAWAAEKKGAERLHAILFLRIAVIGGASLASWLVGLRL